MSDIFRAAEPKGQAVHDRNVGDPTAPVSQDSRPKRIRRTAAQIAAETQVDAFAVFDRIHELVAPLPKPMRDRILATLNRIYGS